MGEPTDELIRDIEERRESLGAVVAELEHRLRPERVWRAGSDRLRLLIVGAETRLAARIGISPRLLLLILAGGLVVANVVQRISRRPNPEGRWS